MKIQTLKEAFINFCDVPDKPKFVEEDSEVAERVRPTSGVKMTYLCLKYACKLF